MEHRHKAEKTNFAQNVTAIALLSHLTRDKRKKAYLINMERL